MRYVGVALPMLIAAIVTLLLLGQTQIAAGTAGTSMYYEIYLRILRRRQRRERADSFHAGIEAHRRHP